VTSMPSEQHGQQRNIRLLGCLLFSAIYKQDTEIFVFFVFGELYRSYIDYAMFFTVWVFLKPFIFGVWYYCHLQGFHLD